MTARSLTPALWALIVAGPFLPAVQADMPANRVVKYYIRETPTDPQSDVVFIFGLKITARQRDGDSIGWSIVEIRIKEPGSLLRLWIDDAPTTPSADGLWWIDHEDGDSPLDSEFAVTPKMEGTAEAQGLNDDDMDYTLEGDTYSPLPSLFGADVSSQTFVFTFVGESTPYIDGTDEPTAIDDDVDPASGSGG